MFFTRSGEGERDGQFHMLGRHAHLLTVRFTAGYFFRFPEKPGDQRLLMKHSLMQHRCELEQRMVGFHASRLEACQTLVAVAHKIAMYPCLEKAAMDLP